ncbi:MAG: glycosyltransferase family 9 protein [SAR324 cluster bacterium]|nr:glycosyltransferase family 9 protein [SAR324 cluster bacterium]
MLTTPIYRELRKVYPDSRLTLLTSEGFGRVLENNPHLDEIIYHHRKETRNDLKELIDQLRLQKFDLIYDIHNSLRSRWIGWQLKCHVPKLEHWLIEKRTLARELQIRFGWGQFFNGRSQREQWLEPLQRHHSGKLLTKTELFPRAADKNCVEAWLNQNGLQDKSFICIGASASFLLKCWPIQNFKQLIERIIQSGVSVVLVGASGESETEELAEYFKGSQDVFSAAGIFTILQSAALLEMANAVIANDTSIVHLAEAMGTPSIAVFGPTVKEFGYAPMLAQSMLIETDLALRCRPCSRTGKGTCKNREQQICMYSISTQKVWDAAQLLLPKVRE